MHGASDQSRLAQLTRLAGASEPAPAHMPHAPERVAGLDMLRGLLALCVAIYHLSSKTQALSASPSLGNAAAVLGIYSVECFFVISGFCFFHLYASTRFDWEELRRFHIKRFLRIAPLYYVAIALGLLCSFQQAVGPNVGPRRVLENLTLSFGFFHPNHAMVVGGWSIGIEYLFYLAFPALAWLVRSRPATYALLALLLLWAVPYDFWLVQEAPFPRKFHVYVHVPNHAFLFLFGALIADLRARVRARLSPAQLLVLLVLLAWLAARSQPGFVDHFDVSVGVTRVKYLALGVLVVALVALTDLSAAGALRPLAWLGEASYSVYLLHPFANWMVQHWLAPQLPPLLQLACGLAATLALAALSVQLVEKPCNALGHALAARPRHELRWPGFAAPTAAQPKPPL